MAQRHFDLSIVFTTGKITKKIPVFCRRKVRSLFRIQASKSRIQAGKFHNSNGYQSTLRAL